MARNAIRILAVGAIGAIALGACGTAAQGSPTAVAPGSPTAVAPSVARASTPSVGASAPPAPTAAASPSATASVAPSATPTPPLAAIPTGAPVPATTYGAGALALDAAGDVYAADCGAARVFKVIDEHTVAVVAGSGPGDFEAGFEGDGGPALQAQFQCSFGIAFDAAGDLAVSDHGNSRIRLVTPDGTIRTIAGSSHPGSGWGGYGGDGGPATKAQLNNATAIAYGPDGTLYIADRDNDRIRALAPDGTISTIAGSTGGFAGDGGPASSARIDDPAGIAVAPDGTIYFADSDNERIRRIAPDGTITTIAGNGKKASKGDGGPATKASLADPEAILLDPAGDIYVTESEGDRVRVITPDGTIWPLAGTGKMGNDGDGGPAEKATLSGVGDPGGLAMDKDWRLYISTGDRIRVVEPQGTISTFEIGHP